MIKEMDFDLIPLAYPLLFLVLNLNAIVEADSRPGMSYVLEKMLEQQDGFASN
ncbi:hypothetical protein [Photorhabdus khanii]|uniref:hypothetical protein n=1 Tax=Photorhabdus khanii TaxID=1004150 RepID=UPI001F00992B|nr:hypothetical protein [Photorhabdus khanii]